MRFISYSQGYTLTYIREVEKKNKNQTWYENEPTFLNFVGGGRMGPGGGLTAWEITAGLEHFSARGLPADPVSKIDIPFEIRFSVFDTYEVAKAEGWTDEFRREIEEYMMNSPEHGVMYIHVPKPELQPPWPAYETTHWKAIAAKVRELGFDPEEVVAYERDHQNRDSVIQSLQELKQDALVGEIVA